MKTLFEQGNELLRSAHAIALREGADTNWDGFRRSLEAVLVAQSQQLNGTGHVPAATCTAQTYRLPPDESKG